MSHFAERLGSSFSGGRGGGVGSLQPGTIVSSRSSGGGGGFTDARAERRALEIQKSQDTARNTQIQQTLKRQRKRQAGLMKKARKSVKRAGKGERTRIKEGGTKLAARGEQELMSRGLGGTTLRGAFQRGVRSDTQRLLTEQSDVQSQRMSGLFSREAGMAIPEGSLGLQGVGMQSGGLQDYIKMLAMLQGGLS